MNADVSLADKLYEAALVPELWAGACEARATTGGSTSATIFAVDHFGTYRYVTTPNIAEGIAKFSASERARENTRPMRALERFPFSFARETEIMSAEEFENDPIRREFVLPHRMNWEAGWAFQEPTGHVIVISMLRRQGLDHFTDEDLGRLNAAKADIARAAYMSSRLAFNEARTMTETLAMLGLPAAVVGDSGQAIATNAEMEKLSPRIRTGAGNQLLLDNAAANALLQDALQRYLAKTVPSVQSLPLIGRDGQTPLILHLVPIRRAARDIFSRSMAILVVTAVGEVGPPDMRVLCGLFDLTPAEARVARGIAIAQTPEQVAATLGISLETVRSHLKRVMMKTGTTRQAELVLLLSGLGAPGGGGF